MKADEGKIPGEVCFSSRQDYDGGHDCETIATYALSRG